MSKYAVARVKQKRRLAPRRKSVALYMMMLPCFMLLVIYRYIPMGGLVMAFQNFKIVRGIFGSGWAGFSNFISLFSTYTFPMIIRNTIVISGLKLVFGFTAPIILALMLNEVRSNRFKRIVQTTVYFPHFISWIVIANLCVSFFAPSSGMLTKLVHDVFGVQINPLMHNNSFLATLVLSDIWKEAGYSSIIYLAAITGIDPQLYEAAIVDGANRWHQLWYVTLPSLIPIIMTLLLMKIGHILNVGFEQIYVMQNSLVYDVSEVIETYVYKLSFEQGLFAKAAAAGFFKSIIGLVLVLIANSTAKRFDQEVL